MAGPLSGTKARDKSHQDTASGQPGLKVAYCLFLLEAVMNFLCQRNHMVTEHKSYFLLKKNKTFFHAKIKMKKISVHTNMTMNI